MPEAPGESKPFNPLEKRNLAESTVRKLLERPCGPLGSVAAFDGSGVYAIYYSGEFPEYRPLSTANRAGCEVPIYVGRSTPSGSRVGTWEDEARPGRSLWTRLGQHAESVRQVSNLRVDDFKERHLVTDDVFISLAESLLITRHLPVWNVVVDGFGNKDVGEARRGGAMSAWDALHPGRAGAANGPPKTPLLEIKARIQQHFVQVGGTPARTGEFPVARGPDVVATRDAEEEEG